MVAAEQNGVLVMTVWVEGGGLRARLTWTLGVTEPQRGTAVAGSADEVLALVRAWLARVTSGSA
jgi:hypothetical protein